MTERKSSEICIYYARGYCRNHASGKTCPFNFKHVDQPSINNERNYEANERPYSSGETNYRTDAGATQTTYRRRN